MSNLSVKASPIRLNIVIEKNIAHPGKMVSHQADGDCLAEASNEPQLTVSGETPTPRNESVDSIKIAEAIPNEIVVSTGEIAFGMEWRNIILTFE